jgi:hypothetical protein
LKRTRTKSPLRLSKDAERLIAMSAAAIAAGSIVEARYWQDKLEATAAQMMERGNDNAIEAALDQTFQANLPAHELLSRACEAAAESMLIAATDGNADDAAQAGSSMQALLISIPLLAWSKYPIASGPVDEATLAPIRAQLFGHVLADGVRAHISPFLYAIEQLPRGFSETRKLMRKLTQAALSGSSTRPDSSARDSEAAELPADARFLLVGVVAPGGSPLFVWQQDAQAEAHATRNECLLHWIEQCRPSLAKLVPGAAFECGLPDAYFHNCRQCDLAVRPYMLNSSLALVEDSLQVSAPEIGVVVAGVGEARVDEYRISILRKGTNQVVHGVVWPLYGAEDDDEAPSPREALEAIFKEHRVGEVTRLPGTHRPEFCEDCGAPLFYDPDGEAVHAEFPEESEPPPVHYH